MRIAILFSGGKDSTNCLWYYTEQAWDVACLLSLLPKNPDSWMFQRTGRALLGAQAASLGVPILFQETDGEKEDELDDLKTLLADAKEKFGIAGVAAGALASDYQHERISRVCDALGLKTFSPLWHKNQELLLREMIAAGFDIRMARIAAVGLDESWLGRRLTPEDVDRLVALNKKLGLHVGGEGGEFETIVLDGPIFSERITVQGEKAMEGTHRGELLMNTTKGSRLPDP